MSIYKILWWVRGKMYTPLFHKFGVYSYLGKPSFIAGFCQITIGNMVRIFPGCRVEAICEGRIVICDDVSIGPGVNITATNLITIGNGCTFSSNVFVTDLDHSYEIKDVSVMRQPNVISKGTIISENCFIGTGAVILAGTKLGKQVIVGANSVVRGTFPDYSVIAGAPARVLRITKSNSEI